MNHYLEKFGAVTGADRNVNRLARAIGAEASPWASVLPRPTSVDIPDGLGTVAGAATGAYLGLKRGHWFVGTVAGGSIGRNVPSFIIHPELRRAAARNLVVTGAACTTSLLMPGRPKTGFVLGWIVASIATHLGGLK